MKPEILAEIRDILSRERTLALAVLRDGAPYVGLLPYVSTADFSSMIVHASRLALHTAGLVNGAPFAALIREPDGPGSDPLQIRRLTLQGTVEEVGRGSRDYAAGRTLYLERFPTSAPTFELGDFGLYLLRSEGGRYVGGFARARTLGPKDIRALGTDSAGSRDPESA